MNKNTSDVGLTALLWIVLMAAALILRPLLPIDETRYLSVAWEMWSKGNVLVPTLNGALYSQKPPLLFWLIDLGWSIGGVSETWARLVGPLFGLGALWMTSRLARALWPEVLWPEAGAEALQTRVSLAPLMLVSGVYWAVFSTMTMFDMILTFATLVALLGYVKAWKGLVAGRGFWAGMLLAGVGIGLGGMAKGPAILVHTLPVALLAPLWGPRLLSAPSELRWRTWYAGVFASLLLGTIVVLAWAVPAAIVGGAEYREAIFIKQSAGRMVKSFAHRRPFYWFAWVLPLLLLPWTLWPRLWKGVGARQAWREHRGLRQALDDGAVRFVALWAVCAFVVFSAISGKQPHYLLPEFPALALFATFVLSQRSAQREQRREAPGFGHRVPVMLMGGAAFIVFVGLLGATWVAPMLGKTVPDWVVVARPLWLVPAILLAIGAAFMRAAGPRGEGRLIALTTVGVIVFLHFAASPAFSLAYDLTPTARQVRVFQDLGRPVAYIGKYNGEFQFLGRLRKPLDTVAHVKDARVWAQKNPNGILIATVKKAQLSAFSQPLSVRPYRGRLLAMWDASRF